MGNNCLAAIKTNCCWTLKSILFSTVCPKKTATQKRKIHCKNAVHCSFCDAKVILEFYQGSTGRRGLKQGLRQKWCEFYKNQEFDKPKSKSQPQIQFKKGKGNLDSGLSLKSYPNKYLMVNDHPDTCSAISPLFFILG